MSVVVYIAFVWFGFMVFASFWLFFRFDCISWCFGSGDVVSVGVGMCYILHRLICLRCYFKLLLLLVYCGTGFAALGFC